MDAQAVLTTLWRTSITLISISRGVGFLDDVAHFANAGHKPQQQEDDGKDGGCVESLIEITADQKTGDRRHGHQKRDRRKQPHLPRPVVVLFFFHERTMGVRRRDGQWAHSSRTLGLYRVQTLKTTAKR